MTPRPTKTQTPIPHANFFTLSPVSSPLDLLGPLLPQINDSSEAETITIPPYTTDTEMPTYSDSIDIKGMRFYCGFSKAEILCESARECTQGTKCPEGQGCIRYDCGHEEETLQDDNTLDVTNSVPVCPPNFTGVTSSSNVECDIFYYCSDGYVGESSMCDVGLKYDVTRNMCWYEDEVDSDCNGKLSVESPNPTFKPSTLRPTFDTSDLFCPENFVGSTASANTDCMLVSVICLSEALLTISTSLWHFSIC